MSISSCCNYTLARTEVDDLYSSAHDKSAWMTKWNVKHSFSSPMRVQEIMRTASYLPGAVKELEVQARRVLVKYLSKYLDVQARAELGQAQVSFKLAPH